MQDLQEGDQSLHDDIAPLEVRQFMQKNEAQFARRRISGERRRAKASVGWKRPMIAGLCTCPFSISRMERWNPEDHLGFGEEVDQDGSVISGDFATRRANRRFTRQVRTRRIIAPTSHTAARSE